MPNRVPRMNRTQSRQRIVLIGFASVEVMGYRSGRGLSLPLTARHFGHKSCVPSLCRVPHSSASITAALSSVRWWFQMAFRTPTIPPRPQGCDSVISFSSFFPAQSPKRAGELLSVAFRKQFYSQSFGNPALACYPGFLAVCAPLLRRQAQRQRTHLAREFFGYGVFFGFHAS